MRLVIISSTADGRIGLVSERVFADAADATRELGRLFAEGTVDTSGAFYTVDMDTAIPVIVLQQPAAPAPPAAEPEAPVEPAEATEPEPEPDTAAPEADGAAQWPWDLPVVAPEGTVDTTAEPGAGEEDSVEPAEDAADEPEPVSDDEPVASDMDEPYILPALDVEGAPAAEDPAAVAEDPASAETEAEDVPEVAFEEPVDVPVLAAEDEDSPAEEAPAAEDAPPAVEEPVEDDFVLDIPAIDEPSGEPADELEPPSAEEGVTETPLTVAEPQSVLEISAAAEAGGGDSEKVYEPGALNMSEYTCDDCVYVNTCPNQHQKKPAECGSFQWRSV